MALEFRILVTLGVSGGTSEASGMLVMFCFSVKIHWALHLFTFLHVYYTVIIFSEILYLGSGNTSL